MLRGVTNSLHPPACGAPLPALLRLPQGPRAGAVCLTARRRKAEDADGMMGMQAMYSGDAEQTGTGKVGARPRTKTERGPGNFKRALTPPMAGPGGGAGRRSIPRATVGRARSAARRRRSAP